MAQPSPRPTRRLKKGAMLVQDEPRRSPTVLSVLVPCFNEAEILRETVAELTAYLDTGRWRKGPEGDWEILLVDDGSTDGSHSIMVDLAQRDGRVRYLSYRINAGQGQALQKGFAAAQGDWIFCVDADLDYGPEHIDRFLALAEESGAEIVIGSPYMRRGTTAGVPLARLWMSRLMNWYFRRVLNCHQGRPAWHSDYRGAGSLALESAQPRPGTARRQCPEHSPQDHAAPVVGDDGKPDVVLSGASSGGGRWNLVVRDRDPNPLLRILFPNRRGRLDCDHGRRKQCDAGQSSNCRYLRGTFAYWIDPVFAKYHHIAKQG